MSRMEVEVLAVHGWGLDRECWRPLRKILPAGIRFLEWDRGYFGRPAPAVWGQPPSARRILLVHSMGILHAEDLAKGADAIVFLSSFAHFHPFENSAERKSRRVLRRMRGAMGSVPGRVLSEFHERCGLPPEARPHRGAGDAHSPATDLRLLADDLRLLDEGEAFVALLRTIPDRIVLHGDRDQIVPEALGHNLARALGGRTSYRCVDGAGHALPVTHPEAVLGALLAGLVAA